MKKHLLTGILILFALCMNAQTVITGWNFPVNSGTDSLNANVGLPGNLGYDLRFEGNDTTYDVIYFAEGATTYAAAAKGWDNGADTKYWSVKFKAENYTDFKVCSKHYSDADGPRDFKLQWRLSGGTLADVPGGAITVSTDWTTGVLDSLPVPITGQGSSSIYLAWMASSDISVGGGTVTATGETRIDDIVVTAMSTMGENEIVFTNRLAVTPNPNHGTFTVRSTVPFSELRVTDMNGRTVFSSDHQNTSLSVTIPGAASGTYALSVKFEDQPGWFVKKIIIE